MELRVFQNLLKPDTIDDTIYDVANALFATEEFEVIVVVNLDV